MTPKSKPRPSNETSSDLAKLQKRQKHLILGVPLQWMTLMMFLYGAVSSHFNGSLFAHELDIPSWALNLFLMGNVFGAFAHLYTESMLFKVHMSTRVRMRIQQVACALSCFLAVALFII